MRLRFFALVVAIGVAGCQDKQLQVGEASSSGSSGTTSSSGSTATSASSSASSSSSSSTSTSGSSASSSSTTSSSSTSSGSGSTSTTGSSGSSSGSTTGGQAAFCSDMVQPLCTLKKACGLLDPQADCSIAAASMTQQCNDGNLAFDLGAATTCLTALQTASQSSDCNSPLLTLQTNACSSVFKPNVPEGGTCSVGSTNECIPRPDGGEVPCQGPPFASCTGVCSLGPLLGQPCVTGCQEGVCDQSSGTCVPFTDGGPCQGIDTGCEPGVEFCNHDGGAGYCSPRGQPGESCSDWNGDTCAPGSTCVEPADGGRDAYCFAQIAVGQACPQELSGSAICQGNAQCVDGSCQITVAVEGEPCDATIACYGSVCNNPDGGAGVCIDGPTLGQPCNGGACAQGLVCASGTCQSAQTAGESCFSVNCTTGDYCDSTNTCRVLGGLGDACDPNSIYWPCREGHCDTTGHCSAFKAPGMACNPFDLDCSAFIGTTTPTDGGPVMKFDSACQATTDGGGSVCVQLSCP
ncbi:MAG: hypothetical protein JST54_16825 [Deltaproteobacteria bacterium]|nr:hypothetical protein [Deltaproteobacteria bacterium]